MRTLIFVARLLVVPLTLLLFAQWPLRELVQAYSRQANDAAQILFALYAAVAVTAASITNQHLAATGSANRSSKVGVDFPAGSAGHCWLCWPLGCFHPVGSVGSAKNTNQNGLKATSVKHKQL